MSHAYIFKELDKATFFKKRIFFGDYSIQNMKMKYFNLTNFPPFYSENA